MYIRKQLKIAPVTFIYKMGGKNNNKKKNPGKLTVDHVQVENRFAFIPVVHSTIVKRLDGC